MTKEQEEGDFSSLSLIANDKKCVILKSYWKLEAKTQMLSLTTFALSTILLTTFTKVINSILKNLSKGKKIKKEKLQKIVLFLCKKMLQFQCPYVIFTNSNSLQKLSMP